MRSSKKEIVTEVQVEVGRRERPLTEFGPSLTDGNGTIFGLGLSAVGAFWVNSDSRHPGTNLMCE